MGPSCAFISPNKAKEGAQGILRDYSGNFILPWSKKTDFWCKVNLSLSLTKTHILAVVINSHSCTCVKDCTIVQIILFIYLLLQNFEYLLLDIWLNYKSVQDALHVRPVSDSWELSTIIFNESRSLRIQIFFLLQHNLSHEQVKKELWLLCVQSMLDSDYELILS